MDKAVITILQRTRELSATLSLRDITMRQLAERIDVEYEVLKQHFRNKAELVRAALAYEREGFKNIFDTYDFEGTNAIDILMIVSKEVSQRYRQVNPALTTQLKKYYPDLYEEHLQARIDFIFTKITINLTKGINQGMYRQDLSIELVARLYISRLLDIHDPSFFPPERFSFGTLFRVMFEDFVRSIASQEGLKYWEERRSKVDFQID
jgi:AcrR family transcriptional regulator